MNNLSTIWSVIISLIRSFFAHPVLQQLPSAFPAQPPTPSQPTPQPPTPKTIKLSDFCTYLRDFEGQPGDPNYRRNNPGNCRCSSVGYAAMYGHVGCENGFAVFKDYATGWLYLNNLVAGRIKLHPTWTIYDFFANYAPAADANNPIHYAETIAARLGVPPQTLISMISA